MSGHSKWSQIKHKKGLADAKRGVIFGKLARAISVAARDNPDPATNLRLKGEIDRARAVNMPNENIDRAIKRVSDKGATALTEVQAEIIGPGNAAIIVLAITDNSNRTLNELKQIVVRTGGRMAGQGSVAWMFKKSGVIRLTKADDDITLTAIDAGADDVENQDDTTVVYTAPERLEDVRRALGDVVESSGIELIPTTPQAITDPTEQEKLRALLDSLDSHDDVQEVYTNADY